MSSEQSDTEQCGDIRDDEPPLEGQRAYKGPAFLSLLFTANTDGGRGDE